MDSTYVYWWDATFCKLQSRVRRLQIAWTSVLNGQEIRNQLNCTSNSAQLAIFTINGLDWQCYLAGSSKTAPMIFFFNCYGCQLFIWAEFHWDPIFWTWFIPRQCEWPAKLMPYPSSHFHFEINFDDRLYSNWYQIKSDYMDHQWKTVFYRGNIDCCPKFATGLKCLNRHKSKNIWVTRLFFCQNDSLKRELLWQKDSLVTFILFELSMPISNI